MKKPGKTRLGIARTIAATVGRTGLPLAVVQRAKASGSVAFRPRGDVDCDALVAWVNDHPETIAESAASLSYADEELLRIRADRMLREHKLSLAKREVLPSDEVRRVLSRFVVGLKSKSFSSMRTAVQEGGLKTGASSEAIQTMTEIVEQRLRDVYEGMSKGMEGWMESRTNNTRD